MKKKILFLLISGMFVFSVGIVTYALSEEEAAMPVQKEKEYFLSPFQMIPFVSQKKSRKNICDLEPGGPIETICNKKYDTVRAADTGKIDELFAILKAVQEDGAPTEYAKYLTAQLVFSTLPRGEITPKKLKSKLQTNLLAANDNGDVDTRVDSESTSPKTGISRADYEKQLEEDLFSIKSNCPKPGDENWVFSGMCSEYAWINGEKQPIYSKQYAEYGGPCPEDAGAIEQSNVQSIINAKMRSEYDFVDQAGVSTQIACSFNCVSYKCPRYEERERERSQCKNPIYTPFFDKKWSGELSMKEKQLSYERAKGECQDRSYDYVTRPNGTSTLKKIRKCKLTGPTGEYYQDPPDYRPVYLETYCCSCDRMERDPYVSIYDFTDRKYTGPDVLKKIMDSVKKRIKDAPPQEPPELPPPPPSIKDTTPPPPAPPEPPTPPPSPPKEQVSSPPKEDTPSAPTVARFRFTCSVSKETLGAIYVKLKSATVALDEKGNEAPGIFGNISGGGWGGISRSCGSLEDTVPRCIDPRTNTPTDAPLDFIKEFSLTVSDEINRKEHNDWFFKMTSGLRKCKAEEVPTEN